MTLMGLILSTAAMIAGASLVAFVVGQLTAKPKGNITISVVRVVGGVRKASTITFPRDLDGDELDYILASLGIVEHRVEITHQVEPVKFDAR